MEKEKEVEQFYDAITKNFEKYNNRFCDEILEYFVMKYLPKKRIRILDAGGGTGRFAIPLAKKGYDITLSDISKTMLDKAKKISNENRINSINFVKESITDMKNQKNNSFDAVLIMNAILDYCGNHRKALKEIMRVLKPNGILIGNVNNRFVYCSQHELKDGEIGLFKRNMKTGDRFISWGNGKGHWTHEFTLEELKKELK
jgi:ubiquinone/menaquinone biosynthesis C-methylase UbiE